MWMSAHAYIAANAVIVPSSCATSALAAATCMPFIYTRTAKVVIGPMRSRYLKPSESGLVIETAVASHTVLREVSGLILIVSPMFLISMSMFAALGLVSS